MASNKRGLAALILLFIIIVGDIITGVASTHVPIKHDTTSLGTWVNMPSATTELMGNTSYRIVLQNNFIVPNLKVGFTVSCLVPSNTQGAFLQMQYANYSQAFSTNASNFVNLGMPIVIDNLAFPCPGNLVTTTVGSLPSSSSADGFIFRIAGSGGGGVGDNPRFSSIIGFISQQVVRVAVGSASAISTSGFTARVHLTVAVSVSTVENFQWIATNNGGTVQSGSGSCTAGIAAIQCILSVTFSPAFGTTPNVVVTATNLPTPVTFEGSSLDFFIVQDSTV